MAGTQHPDTLQRRSLTLNELRQIDGGLLEVLFDRAMKQIGCDCEERPDHRAAREVVLSVKVKPVVDTNGQQTGMNALFSVEIKLPKQTKTYPVGIDCGCVMVNAGVPDNYDQHALPGMDKKA